MQIREETSENRYQSRFRYSGILQTSNAAPVNYNDVLFPSVRFLFDGRMGNFNIVMQNTMCMLFVFRVGQLL